MKKILAVFAVLLLCLTPDAFAGKSYSSGSPSSGRSFSSSSSSGSKSYSSGSKPSGSSYSSGSKPSGSSFATKPSTSSPAQSTAQSGGKKYSSGSTPPKSDPAATSGGKKYSSGSTPPVKSDPPKSDLTGKKYSSGSNPPATGPPNKSVGNSKKPSGSGFNNAMSNDAKHQESKTRYEAATAPKATYSSRGADGKVIEKPIKADAPQVQTVRRYVTHERYVTYDNRATVFYGGYYGHPVYYHDYYSPFLMGWILSDACNSHDRALWMYHHQYDMDQARYAELLRRDAQLQAEIDQLKSQNIARDGGYVPRQMADNPDLMFNKEFVDASYNPQEVQTNSPSDHHEGSGAGTFFFWLFIVFVVIVVGGILIYFIFMREY